MAHYEEPTKKLKQKRKELGYYPKPDDFEPKKDFPEGHFHFGKVRCHAWNSYHGRQCMGLARVKFGTDKCKGCGGNSNKGVESPRYKHGRTSRYTPKVPSRYPDYLDDPNYLALGPEMGLVTERIDELYNQVDVGESARLWKEAKKQFAKLRKAIADSDPEKLTDAISSLDGLLLSGNATWAKWGEIDKMIESRRRLADTERKRVEAAQQSLRANTAIELYQSMVLSNRDVIKQLEDQIRPEDVTIQGDQVSISNKAKNRILTKIGANFRTYIDRSNISPNQQTD